MTTQTEADRREALGQRVDELTDELCRLGIAGAPAADIEAAKDSLRTALRDWNATWRQEVGPDTVSA